MSSSTRTSSLRRAAATAVLLLLALFVLDRGLFRLIVAAENSFYKDPGYAERFDAYAAGKHFDALILGTSRAYEGIHPVYFRKALKLNAFKDAFKGRGPRYNLSFYRFFKERNGAPRLVVYGVDYFMFAARSAKSSLTRFEPDRGPFRLFAEPSALLGNKKEVEDFLNDLGDALEQKLKPRPSGPKRDFLRNETYAGKPPKGKPLPTAKPKQFLRQIYLITRHTERAYFRTLLKEWNRDGVLVVLATIPDHIGSYETNFENDKFLEDLRRQAAPFPNVRFFDFNRPDLFPLDKAEYFINGGWGLTNSHLSKKGARLYNKRLIAKIRPLLRAAGAPKKRPRAQAAR